MVTLLLGDNPYCFRDIEMVKIVKLSRIELQSLNLKIPIVVLEGTQMANELFDLKEELSGEEVNEEEEMQTNRSKKEVMSRLAKSRFIRCKESSEDLASIIHLLLAVTLY